MKALEIGEKARDAILSRKFDQVNDGWNAIAYLVEVKKVCGSGGLGSRPNRVIFLVRSKRAGLVASTHNAFSPNFLMTSYYFVKYE